VLLRVSRDRRNQCSGLGAYRHVTSPTDIPVDSQGEVDLDVESTAEPSFEDLYQSHYPRMVALARLMTDVLVVAEEVVQDAFVQLYRNWSAVEHPVAYLRIAVINGCRSQGRRRAVERRHRPSVHEPVVVDTNAIAVRDALGVLTPRQRAAVVLRYFEDLPERDIAEMLGCRPGTVKSLLSRSLTKLKGTLHD
jgi:RNA polymerase sigma-70 factor (sigma-E family)